VVCSSTARYEDHDDQEKKTRERGTRASRVSARLAASTRVILSKATARTKRLAVHLMLRQVSGDDGLARAWHLRYAHVAFTAEPPWISHYHVNSPHGPRCSKRHDRPRKTSLVGPPVIILLPES
jgi:hypothetical protein